MDNKCKCGHEHVGLGVCWHVSSDGVNTYVCKCKKSQPCVEPEPPKIEQMWICPDAVGACVGCMRASEHIHNEQCVGGKQCIQWSSPTCVPVKPEPETPLKSIMGKFPSDEPIEKLLCCLNRLHRNPDRCDGKDCKTCNLYLEPPEPQGRISPLASTGYKLKFQKCKYCGGLARCLKRGWECLPDKPAPPIKCRIVLTTDLTCNCGEQMRKDESSANTQLQSLLAQQAREILEAVKPFVYGYPKDAEKKFEALKSKYCEEK
jgi:hypothetical protein